VSQQPTSQSLSWGRLAGRSPWLLAAVSLLSGLSPTSADGQWRVTFATDPMTDARQATFALTASTGAQTPSGARAVPTLAIRCVDEGVDDALFSTGGLLGGELAVELRFDSGPVETQLWSGSTDKRAVFSPAAYAFVDSILTHKSLLIRFAPPLENPRLLRFALGSLREQDAALKRYCGFTASERLAEIDRRTPTPVSAVLIDSAMTVVRLKQPGELNGLRLIAGVVGIDGKPVIKYHAVFELRTSLGSPAVETDDSLLRFAKGTTYVRVIVNGTPATQVVRVEVP
jgi:hypothetical protein